jgi:ubiquinone/menaquinone biosynthesis C-methylase UbiE
MSADLYADYDTIQCQVARRWLPPRTGKILEIGCSAGYFTHKLQGRADEVYGIDINREHIEQARQKYPDIHFHCADCETLPYDDATFDVVVMLEVYEHVADRQQLVGEIARVLRPGGMLILSTPHRGMFSFLDSFHLKLRLMRSFPRASDFLTRRVQRYQSTQYTDNLSWHPHFSLAEVQQSLGDDFIIEKVHRGGLLIFPTFAILRSLTVRMVKNRALFNALVGVMNLDGAIPYGPLAYNLQILARKRPLASEDAAVSRS